MFRQESEWLLKLFYKISEKLCFVVENKAKYLLYCILYTVVQGFLIYISERLCYIVTNTPMYLLYCIMYTVQEYFTILCFFWLILGQWKTSLVFFLWKRRMSSVFFLVTILFLMAYIRQLEITLDKKTTELVLLFHKKTTKLVFLWPNIGQKASKC